VGTGIFFVGPTGVKLIFCSTFHHKAIQAFVFMAINRMIVLL